MLVEADSVFRYSKFHSQIHVDMEVRKTCAELSPCAAFVQSSILGHTHLARGKPTSHGSSLLSTSLRLFMLAASSTLHAHPIGCISSVTIDCVHPHYRLSATLSMPMLQEILERDIPAFDLRHLHTDRM